MHPKSFSHRAFAHLGLLAICTLAAPITAQTNSSLVSHLPLGNDTETRDVCVDGNTAYVARNSLGVDIIDVTNPTNPTKIGQTLNPDPNGTVRIRDVAVHAGHLYAIDYSGVVDSQLGNFVGLYIYDVGNPANPVRVGYLLWGDLNVPWSWRAGQNYNGTVATVAGKPYFFATSRITNAVEVFDVSNPAAPVWKAVIHRPASALFAQVHDIFVQNNKLYTSWYSGGFTVHDVSNVGSTIGVGNPYGPQPVTLLVHHMYASAWTTHVAATADDQYVVVTEISGNRTRIFDVRNPQNVVESGSVAGSSNTKPHKLMVLGDLAYVAHFEDGLRAFEITDKTNPAAVAWFDTQTAPPQNLLEGAHGLDLSGGNVFVSDSSRGLFILSVQDSVQITRARYRRNKQRLTIHATTTASPAATLTVQGFGVLTYHQRSGTYRGKFTTPTRPASVTVTSSVGGTATTNL